LGLIDSSTFINVYRFDYDSDLDGGSFSADSEGDRGDNDSTSDEVDRKERLEVLSDLELEDLEFSMEDDLKSHKVALEFFNQKIAENEAEIESVSSRPSYPGYIESVQKTIDMIKEGAAKAEEEIRRAEDYLEKIEEVKRERE
jgi:hypothetical protein